MRVALFASVLVVLAAGVRADAQVIQVGGSEPFAGPVMIGGVVHSPPPRGPVMRTPIFDSRSGTVIPTVTRLHPVVGSGQRSGHFAGPFAQRAGYSETVYNPLLGQFGTLRFRR
jgi:hypothetical protein